MNNQKGTVYEIGTGIESETFALTLIGEGGGVQNSSTSNHRHPNVFCGKRAPQLVISTTSIGNQPK